MLNEVGFAILGPLQVLLGGRTVLIRSPKYRIVLAALLLNAGSLVTVEHLTEAVWGGRPPTKPRHALHLLVMRLRKLLLEGGALPLVETGADGYRIDVPPDRLDIGVFERCLEEADRAAAGGDLTAESAALDRALRLWRGEPLANVPSDLLQRRYGPWLAERRLRVVERQIDVNLALGRHTEMIEVLVRLTGEEPLREKPWVQLMTALDRAGRRADALEAFHTGRRHLAAELGVDPGAELVQAHARILAGGAASNGAATLDGAVVGPPVVPRQLPAETVGFTARKAEVRRLELLLSDEAAAAAAPPRVVTVTGMAGVGKTAFALHLARRVAHHFPDGQLWINLRGPDRSTSMTAQSALTSFLRALGAAEGALPDDLHDQAGLYRTLMDGRRVLVVLDDAQSAEQVRPLLPGAPGCAVVITSRHDLAGLTATVGAMPVRLEPFTDDEARQMLRQRLGEARLAAEPAAVDRLIARTSGLPLALAIVAARAVARPAYALDAIERQLAAAVQRLDGFGGPDLATDLRALFSWSYQGISEPAGALFRLLGLHPVREMSIVAAGSLSGRPSASIRACLDELAAAHMIILQPDDRVIVHDLLHAYAAELCASHDSPHDRRAATRRMLDHYVHTAHEANKLFRLLQDHIEPTAAAAGVEVPQLADMAAAIAWFSAERPALVAAVDVAAAEGLDAHAWRLSCGLAEALIRNGNWQDVLTVQTTGLAAAKRASARPAQACCHMFLARAYQPLGRPDLMVYHLEPAMSLYRDLADSVGQARAHQGLSSLAEQRGDLHTALAHDAQAVELYRQAGHRGGEALALNALGWDHALLGAADTAIRYCQEALRLCDDLGDHSTASTTWDSLGFAYRIRGDRSAAIEAYGTSLRLRRKTGMLLQEAHTQVALGDAFQAFGELDAACTAWRAGLKLLDQINASDARDVRRRVGHHLGREGGPDRVFPVARVA